MKKIFLVILVFFAGTAHAKEDGTWWTDLSETARTYYLIGYIRGATNAYFVAPMVVCVGNNHVGKALTECIQSGLTAVNNKRVGPMTGKPFSQFIDGVNTFYGDYRNKSICFQAALSFVVAEINGMKKEQADEWVQILRSGSSQSCD